MNHDGIQPLLADYRDLRGEERRAVDAHVAVCKICAGRLAEHREMDVAIQSLRDAPPDPQLRARYRAALAGADQPGARPAARRVLPYALAAAALTLVIGIGVWILLRPTGGGTPRAAQSGVTPVPTVTPVSTPEATVPAPTAGPTTDPRLVIWPRWEEFEQSLSRAALGAQLANRVCDWTVLGRDGNSFYVWAYCAAYYKAPEFTATSLPAVLRVSENNAAVGALVPRDGTHYAEDVRTLFPPAVQQQITDGSFEPAVAALEQHARLRLRWPALPPLGAAEIAPPDPNGPTMSATVRIFSGRPDPTWQLTQTELAQLDALLRGLALASCDKLPDRLGYRGVAVALGGMDGSELVAYGDRVMSDDTGISVPDICLGDPERTVEHFLLTSAQPYVDADTFSLLTAFDQQPLPAPTLAPGWVSYADGKLDIVLGHPDGWEVGTQTDWSRVWQLRSLSPSGPAFPPFWFTVLPPDFRNEDASAYNFSSPEEIAQAWETPSGAPFESAHSPAGYNTYTRFADTTVDGFPAAVVENWHAWEAPEGMRERRALVKIGRLTVMFGTYYTTVDELRTFEQVLASVKFGSLLLARGAASLTPQPAAAPGQ